MRLRFLSGRYQGRVVEMDPKGFIIGRVGGCHLVIDEDGISREHCKFYRRGDKWLVDDLQSTNGVRINGTRITVADIFSYLPAGETEETMRAEWTYLTHEDFLAVYACAAVNEHWATPARD